MNQLLPAAMAPALISWLSLAAAGSPADAPGPMRVGVAIADTTPEEPVNQWGFGGRKRPSDGIARQTQAQCVLFDNGQTRVALVALDMGSISYQQLLRLRASAEKAGIPQQHLMVNVSHTHYTSGLGGDRNLEYDALLSERLQPLFADAVADLKPALLDYTVGSCDMGFNRRSCYGPGGRKPIDPDVPVLRVLEPDGKVRAVLFGYACHPTTASGRMLYLVDTDYPGYARDWVSQAYSGAPTIFFQGCGGDVKPGLSGDAASVWRAGPLNEREAKTTMGYELGRAVVKATAGHGSSHPTPPPLPPAAAAAGRMPTERERGFPIPPPPVPADRPTDLEKALATPVALGGIVEVVAMPSKTDPEVKGRLLWHTGAWRVGDVYFFAGQGEVLSAIGRRIKTELPELRVWTCGYSHYGSGYFPEAATFPEAGYEVQNAVFGPGAEEVMVGNALRYIKELQTQPIHRAPVPRSVP
ncbi:MAG: hypothetical protein HY321_16500 [Armatimonadetes bacterium]|nr:hypothetical protein [Armatimonadota bacterium]